MLQVISGGLRERAPIPGEEIHSATERLEELTAKHEFAQIAQLANDLEKSMQILQAAALIEKAREIMEANHLPTLELDHLLGADVEPEQAARTIRELARVHPAFLQALIKELSLYVPETSKPKAGKLSREKVPAPLPYIRNTEFARSIGLSRNQLRHTTPTLVKAGVWTEGTLTGTWEQAAKSTHRPHVLVQLNYRPGTDESRFSPEAAKVFHDIVIQHLTQHRGGKGYQQINQAKLLKALVADLPKSA